VRCEGIAAKAALVQFAARILRIENLAYFNASPITQCGAQVSGFGMNKFLSKHLSPP
jgi:hypothetical protein